MRRFLLVALAGCGGGGDRYTLSDGDVTFVRVRGDGRVVQLPGMSQDNAPVFTLQGTRVVGADGKDVVACRGERVFEGDREVAQLRPDGFTYLTTRITIDGASATVHRAGDTDQTLRYTGDPDRCTAALLFFMVPVPRAG